MSRVIACWLVVLLALQGFAAAGQRALPGGHVHTLPSHDHDADAHFHLAVGFHPHEAAMPGLVQVDAEDAAVLEAAISATLKRLALDQPQVRSAALTAASPTGRAGARTDPFVAWRSYVGLPHERPPRPTLT